MAADSASDVLDWSTLPSVPSLLIRTGRFVLLAPFWVESADELASWPVIAFWPTAWTRSPPQLQPPPCFWLTPCVVSARLPAADSAAEVFDCVTSPLEPGESIRTEMLPLLGWSCVDVASELASWPVAASWPAAWTPSPEPLQPQPPPCCCSAPCSVVALLPAIEPAAEVLD